MTLRCKVIWSIFKRNFSSYFSGVLGYLFIVVFVVAGVGLLFTTRFFTANEANLDQLTQSYPLLLLFIIPAITMGVWADERKTGTDELLFTLPATDLEILLGKYFSVLAVYSVVLLFSTTHIAWLLYLGSPDWGLILATYFGYWLAGAAMLSAGMLASILTRSITVAFVLGVLICGLPVFIGYAAGMFSGRYREFLESLSIQEQFRDLGMGIVPAKGLLYFLGFTIFMLYLNLVFMTYRHWSSRKRAKMELQFSVRMLCLAVVVICVTAWAGYAAIRVDATYEQLFTLSPATRTTLRELDPERAIEIQAFLSPEVPQEYVDTRKQLVGLLRQFDELAGQKIEVRIVDVAPYSEEAEQAEKFGIDSVRVFSQRDGRASEEDIYLGAVVISSYDKVVVPFFGKGLPIEYELTRTIRTVENKERLTVGILDTDAMRTREPWQLIPELEQQYEVETVSPTTEIDVQIEVSVAAKDNAVFEIEFLQPALRDVTELIQVVSVEDLKSGGKSVRPLKTTSLPRDGGNARQVINLNKADSGTFRLKYDGAKSDLIDLAQDDVAEQIETVLNDLTRFDVLIAILPSSLTDPEMFNLVNYVKAGNPVLIFDDPYPGFGATPPSKPKPRPGGHGMFGQQQQQQPPPKSDGGRATKLLNAIHLDWKFDRAVFQEYNPHAELDHLPPEILFTARPANENAFSSKSPITKGLQEVVLMYAGSVEFDDDDDDVEFTPLLVTGKESGLLEWNEFIDESQFSMQGPISQPRSDPNRKFDDDTHILAARITSDNEDSPLNAVYVADADIISNVFFRLRNSPPPGFNAKFDNVTFILNAVDELAGDDSFIALRSRRAAHRSLETIEARKAAFEKKANQQERAADDAAKEELDKRKENLKKRVEEIKKDDNLDPDAKDQMMAQATQAEQSRLARASAQIEDRKRREIKMIKTKKAGQERTVERGVQIWAFWLSPIPALCLGLVMFILQLQSEKRNLVETRRRQR